MIVCALACCFLVCPVPQDEPKAAYNSQKETISFPTADEALAKMELPASFKASVFASEPDLTQPIGFTTDERGRLWVVENNTYAERKLNFDTELRDRVVILEDSTGDGVADKHTVFWDEGVKATSVEVGFGGVYVLAPPKLMFIPDADRDDVPDGPPEILLDGFDHEVIRHNLANGLMWGPDGWLYGRHGIQATSVVGKPGATASQRTNVTCGIWRFHPVRKEFQVVASGGTNPWGMDFNKHGEFFMINTVIGHLWHVVPGAYYRRMYGSHFNPYVYDVIEQTADHFHWDTGDEKWNDAKKGALTDGTDRAGGGHAHSGFMIYQGNNWPDRFRNKAFTLNFHGRRMNVERLVRDGNGYTGKHEPDVFETKDQWFRGVELKAGPDGAVYVLDWSDIGECHENDGVHRSSGRIYKLWYERDASPETPTSPRVDLSQLSNKELVALALYKENEWHVRAARRVLMERAASGKDMTEVVNQLLTMGGEKTVEHELRTMWCAYCVGHQEEAWLLSHMTNPNEHIRAWAIRLLCDRHGELSQKAIDAFAYQAEFEKSGLVRLYLASAMNRMPLKNRFDVAIDLVHYPQDADDRMQPLMIWYGIEPAVTAFPKKAVTLALSSQIPLVRKYIARRLAVEIGDADTIDPLVAALGSAPPNVQADLLSGISDSLRGVRKAKAPAGWDAYAAAASKNSITGKAVREIGVVFGNGRALDDVKRIARDRGAADDARIAAIGVLANARPDDLFQILKPMVNDRVAGGAAVRAMAVCDDVRVPNVVLNVYGRLSPEDKAAAIDTLVARRANAGKLLDAVADGRVKKSVISAFHARQMRGFGDEKLSAKLAKVWGEVRESSAERRAMMESVRETVSVANAKPDTLKGQALFKKNCASCHVMFGDGGNIGPDLTGSNRSNLNYLLENVVDPSASVAASFRASIIVTEDGRSLSGVVVAEDDRSITLQTDKEKRTIAKSDIEDRKQTSQSLMPEGLLKGLSDEQLVDLFGYLRLRTRP